MKISLSIDVSKIDREKHIKRFGKNQKPFLKLTLIEKEGEYGDDGFASVYLAKEDLEPGQKGGPIVGNWRYLTETAAPKPAASTPAAAAQSGSPAEDDDLPFAPNHL